ncbi:MAG TPA: amphi-Trp domain-containing protein [Verrucomicrobiae bacterium]|nr:amphi-Trp domain-containing protein [Verrucomicrobiae bacterium]
MPKKSRDITKIYPVKSFIQKIRRLAKGLENKKKFTIQIANERITVPKGAVVNIEHERSKHNEEIEFQITWKRPKK